MNYGYNDRTNLQGQDDYDVYGETDVLSSQPDTGYQSLPVTEQLVSKRGPVAELVRLNTNMKYAINEGDILLLGRGRSVVHIYVDNNQSVSTRHAQLSCAGGQCIVTDLTSTNGTYINDIRLIPGKGEVVNSGDYITLGNEIFQFWKL